MRRPNAVQTLALGFALLILAGACLLSLPIAFIYTVKRDPLLFFSIISPTEAPN